MKPEIQSSRFIPVPGLDLRAPIITKIRQGVGVGSLRVLSLLGFDGCILALAWTLAVQLGQPLAFDLWSVQGKPGLIVPILIVSLGVIAASGLWGTDTHRRDYWGLTQALTLAQGLLLLLAFLSQPGLLLVSRSTFLLAWAFSIGLVCWERWAVDWAIRHIRRQGAARWPIYLIGDPEDTAQALALIGEQSQFRILGVANLPQGISQERWQATVAHICRLGVGEVFMCSWQRVEDPMSLYWNLQSAGIQVRILPLGLELPRQRSEVRMIDRLPSILFSPPAIIGGDFWIKRYFDFGLSVLFLVVAAPLYLGIALLITLDSPGPVFYRQTRIGLKGKPFQAWKFRTMVQNADQLQTGLEAQNEMNDGVLFKMRDDPRVTKVGRLLRQYSLDELPQLFNVLLGQMSLVGPRPFPARDVARFSEHHFLRHEVLPGITGLWQVSGRSKIMHFEEVLRLDIDYIQNWSLALDFQILLKTIAVVLRREGAY